MIFLYILLAAMLGFVLGAFVASTNSRNFESDSEAKRRADWAEQRLSQVMGAKR